MKTEILIQDKKVEVFTLGNYLPIDKNAVAIVGSRQSSFDGKKIAHKFAYFLAKKNITIVSGLAVGVDTMAHKGALDAKGRTIAILAHGLDTIYPNENVGLANRIIKSGCLMTKFTRGTVPLAYRFLERNQLIAGISKAVLVVEGQERSGSISTANHAANLGVEVFAIPGSPATDWLIDQGANIANSPEDIINYLNL